MLDYNYFNKNYKIIAIDLIKQQASIGDPKAIQQIDFTGNLEQDNGAIMFVIIEEAKEAIRFFTSNCKGIANVLDNIFLF